jgi:hypothetical protein
MSDLIGSRWLAIVLMAAEASWRGRGEGAGAEQ